MIESLNLMLKYYYWYTRRTICTSRPLQKIQLNVSLYKILGVGGLILV